jgi:hypothetical protein
MKNLSSENKIFYTIFLNCLFQYDNWDLITQLNVDTWIPLISM